METNPNLNKWQQKLKTLLGLCHTEIKRTQKIGAQMISASKINSELNQKYQALGSVIYNKIKQNELSFEEFQVNDLIQKIDYLKDKLARHEEELRKIKESKEV